MPSTPLPSLPPSLVPQINLNNTFGAAFIGGFVTAVLYGMTSIQCYSFFVRSARDSRALKISVGILWILNTAHMAFIMHIIYLFLITNFGNVLTLVLIPAPWSVGAAVFATNLINAFVPILFAFRVWVLSERKKLVVIPIGVLEVIGICFGTATCVTLWKGLTFPEFSKKHWIYFTSSSLYSVADLYTALVLCYYLLRQRDGSHRRTYSVVNTLLIYAINTGLLTSILTMTGVILAGAMPNNLVFLAVYFSSCEWYTNSLLASLNARDRLRQELHIASTRLQPSMIATGGVVSAHMTFAPGFAEQVESSDALPMHARTQMSTISAAEKGAV